jgi:hypothetical protein
VFFLHGQRPKAADQFVAPLYFNAIMCAHIPVHILAHLAVAVINCEPEHANAEHIKSIYVCSPKMYCCTTAAVHGRAVRQLMLARHAGIDMCGLDVFFCARTHARARLLAHSWTSYYCCSRTRMVFALFYDAAINRTQLKKNIRD